MPRGGDLYQPRWETTYVQPGEQGGARGRGRASEHSPRESSGDGGEGLSLRRSRTPSRDQGGSGQRRSGSLGARHLSQEGGEADSAGEWRRRSARRVQR